MSAQVVRNFFPVLLHCADSNHLISTIINAVFPHHIQQLCPVPVIHLQGDVQLRWPAVAVVCICGCFFNLFAGGHLLYGSAITKERFNGYFSWAFAFLWYALMCLGGLIYHCILPSPLFLNIDVIGTACSSLSIVAGSILADDTTLRTRITLLAVYASVTMVAVCGPQSVREFLYLGPALVALGAAAWFLWRVNEKGEKHTQATREALRNWSAVAAAGVAVGIGGVVCDKWLCIIFGSNYSMLFWFFLGADVAIFAFFPILLLLQRSSSRFKDL